MIEDLTDEQLEALETVLHDKRSDIMEMLRALTENVCTKDDDKAYYPYDLRASIKHGIAREQHIRAKHNETKTFTLTIADAERMLGWISGVESEGLADEDDYKLGQRLTQMFPQAECYLDFDELIGGEEQYKKEQSVVRKRQAVETALMELVKTYL